MCEICHQSPCMPGCPNAPEPPGFVCKRCGETITEGESYFEAYDGKYCEDCLWDMTPPEILNLVSEEMSTVTYEDLEEDIW